MLFTQRVRVAWADGTESEVDLDQRDLIAAADAGAPLPNNVDDTVGLIRYMRKATEAHLRRAGDLDGDFDDLVIEVAPDVEDEQPEVNPTNPAT